MVSLSHLKSSKPGSSAHTLAAPPFEFDVFQVSDDISWLSIDPPSDVSPIASDCSGGCYVRYGQYKTGFRFLHASSEGITTQLASTLDSLISTLDSLISIIIAIPNWSDVAHRDLETMRQRYEATVAGEQDLPFDVNDLTFHDDESVISLQNVRNRLAADLILTLPNDPVEQLHNAICAGESLVIHVNDERSLSAFW